MKVCISCSANLDNKPGIPIKEDRIIKTIRGIKKVFGIAQNNELYVCMDCYPKHAERRKSFEKSMLFASVFAGLILIVLVAAIVLSGHIDVWALFSAFIIAGFVLVLPVFKYAPGIEGEPPVQPSPVIPPPPPMPTQPAPPMPFVQQSAKTESTPKKKKTRSKKTGD